MCNDIIVVSNAICYVRRRIKKKKIMKNTRNGVQVGIYIYYTITIGYKR